MSSIIMPYMLRPAQQVHVTESYVSSPPALMITDEVGDVWTLGTAEMRDAPRGERGYDVLRNGVATGEVASRIERRAGRIRVFTQSGWKRWTGSTFI